ncbi:MAG: protein translocase subunit SecD [Caulobacteraceae bacterium]
MRSTTAALKAERLTNLTEDVRTTLRDKRIDFSGLGVANGAVELHVTDPGQVEAAFQALSQLGNPLPSGGGRDVTVQTQPNQTVRLSISDRAMQEESVQAVRQSIEVIRRRVDQLGTREPTIIQQGSNRIVVEAPGESDPERLKQVIGQTAKLTFQMVDDTVSADDMTAGRVRPDRWCCRARSRRRSSWRSSAARWSPARCWSMPPWPSTSTTGRPSASASTARGARRFGEATSQNVGKRFAIVLDNKIISAPTIQEPITSGSGQITGSFTQDYAQNLSLMLRSGALPAPLRVMEQRTVGAELGADAIRAGQVSLTIGAVAIFVFIILAYGLFGLFAALALVVNGLMLIGVLSLTQSTMTLPGIAGLVLTLAVAVDANVLIYERMRDEARAGRSVMASLDHGYSLALPSIMDANLTTLIAAMIMFELGSGPVKGFALTLLMGVLTSVFTAVLITQVLIGWWFRAARPKKLPI